MGAPPGLLASSPLNMCPSNMMTPANDRSDVRSVIRLVISTLLIVPEFPRRGARKFIFISTECAVVEKAYPFPGTRGVDGSSAPLPDRNRIDMSRIIIFIIPMDVQAAMAFTPHWAADAIPGKVGPTHRG